MPCGKNNLLAAGKFHLKWIFHGSRIPERFEEKAFPATDTIWNGNKTISVFPGLQPAVMMRLYIAYILSKGA